MATITLKRIYDTPSEKDGYRILIDRLWPRGISKEKAQLNEWLKEIAPSDELRKWFGHLPERFEEFSVKYQEELSIQENTLIRLKNIAKEQPICLLYGAKDTTHNQAVVLKKILEKL